MKIILTFCLMFFAAQALAENENRFLTKNEWPVTCTAAVDWVVDHLDDKSKIIVKETPKGDLIKYHHGWGTGIRNNFGLWHGNKSLMRSCLELRKNMQIHPDSISMIIIEETWARLNGVKWNKTQ